MRFCAAMMAQNEADWLRLALPALSKSSSIDGIIVLDGGSSDDTVAVAQSLGATVFHRTWDWRPLDQENYLIECAEREGYDAMLFTAPDELWFARDLDEMKRTIERYPQAVLQFPTINFVKDRLHFAPNAPYFPDYHQRVWTLGQGVRHVGKIDSIPGVDPDRIYLMPHIYLFHYSSIKDRRYYNWKGHNFNRVKDGLPPLDIPWQDMPPAPYPEHIPYTGKQPLDPYEIGIRAPYSEGVF